MASILLIEDQELNRDMLCRRLARAGHHVTVAEDGEVGIRRAEQDCPDLILMDLGLPVVDGWTATERLKAMSSTAHIPIIALTARVMPEDRDRAYAAGCDAFETKPVDFNRLLTRITSLLPNAEDS